MTKIPGDIILLPCCCTEYQRSCRHKAAGITPYRYSAWRQGGRCDIDLMRLFHEHLLLANRKEWQQIRICMFRINELFCFFNTHCSAGMSGIDCRTRFLTVATDRWCDKGSLPWSGLMIKFLLPAILCFLPLSVCPALMSLTCVHHHHLPSLSSLCASDLCASSFWLLLQCV